jgi:hypothetical protein
MDEFAYALGANRSEVHSERDKAFPSHEIGNATVFPAQVEIEEAPPSKPAVGSGVFCITGTPGPNTLLDLLLKRIWGVDCSAA